MININQSKLEDINTKLDEIAKTDSLNKKTTLMKKTIVDLNNLFSARETKNFINQVKLFNESNSFDYEDLAETEDTLKRISSNLSRIKTSVDYDSFFKKGANLDISKIKEKFRKKRLSKEYPNFNFNKLKELYTTPPKTIKTYYNDEEILVDEFIFRKYVVGIIQMVLDQMDLVTAVTGGEGTGKSTHVSQLMGICYYIITELGISDYKFNIKDMFFNSLESLRIKEDELFEERFRILTLDEGNELHRQNWRDEEVQTFFQRLRRERFNQRIKFICIPVLGELMTNIVLSRVNFIMDMQNTNDVKTGSLNKGKVDFYIIPRGDKVYSPYLKQDLSKGKVKSILYETLKDKNFLKGIPDSIKCKRYSCNGVWSFPYNLYVKELKESNKSFKVAGGFKLTDLESFYLYKARVSLKAIGLDSKDAKYSTLNKFLNRLKKYFEESPDRYKKYELILKRKEEEKKIKEKSNF